MALNVPTIDIKKDMQRVSKMGFIRSKRKDNTGIGFTLETLLGIPENNKGEPDFIYEGLPIELKSQRKKASSRITLSTKSPVWNPLRDREIVKKMGYRDKKGRIGLKITLKTNEFNAKGFKLCLNLDKDRLDIVHKKFGCTCFFQYSKLLESIRSKIYENLLLVTADTKKTGKIEYFHYVGAILFSKFKEEKFTELLQKGIVVWEFRMHLKDSGSVRDHGSGLRISKKYMDDLFESSEKIL
jgi:hypothetical protein